MEAVEAYLALGSNMGDRRANISKALEMISALPGTSLERVSDTMESAADGFDGPDFLNCCCAVRTSLTPNALLSALKGIERALGRTDEGIVVDSEGKRVYKDRTMDIDILTYGDMEIMTGKLQIPHPRMKERGFVMKPLGQIMK